MKRKNPITLFGVWLALAFTSPDSAHAATNSSSSSTATVSGRVQNLVTGQYLNKARVTVQGTNIVTFTDEFGGYRIANAPRGPIVLEVFYTDLDPQQITVEVPPSGSVERNIELTSATR